MNRVKFENGRIRFDADRLFYKDLNFLLRDVLKEHKPEIISIHNVYGQRYIGTNLRQNVKIEIYGTPGNDLGAFMDGPTIEVFGNAQDGCGNTMNSGEIVVHGSAGDITGFAARGGEIFVKDDVGYRVGIHMKEYQGKKPTLVIGGTAQDFLGEYMAGGTLIVFGLYMSEEQRHRADFIGTGMHGGTIYIRGKVEEHQLGKELGKVEMKDDDWALMEEYAYKYAEHFGYNHKQILNRDFVKLVPLSLRPYGKLYAY
ncbi:hypothetical protein GF312_19820 [Candidatus Poribacteria bacterium]|nr:hypothetical protein [Candidatus Poribacteria bacterium]